MGIVGVLHRILGKLRRGGLLGTICCFVSLVVSVVMCAVCVPLVSVGVVCVLRLVVVCAVRCALPRSVCVGPVWARVWWCVRPCLWSLLQVRRCVFLRRGVRVSAASGGVLPGDLQALALLVLPPEPSQFGAPVLPPVEGDGGAVRHQPVLPRRPVPSPFLCTNQEEGPANLEGRAATAEVTVWNPEGLLAPAHAGRPHAEHGLHPYRELPPGPGTFHSFHLHLQNCEKETRLSQTTRAGAGGHLTTLYG